MTIQFKGHIMKVEANVGKIAVTVQTPMEETNGMQVVLNVPASAASHWLVGSPVQFTIHALPKGTTP
jgi:hypothetical protein